MKLKVFIQNVRSWATVRGIYAQSSEEKQIEKFWEECREYLVARTRLNTMDGIGDMAATIVNASWFKDQEELSGLEPFASAYSNDIPSVCSAVDIGSYISALCNLRNVARSHCCDFEDCLQMAWDEIKDRKGLMIDGLYVKWDNLNDEQRIEFSVNLARHIESDC